MNLLQIVQEFCRRTQLPVPTGVATSRDEQVVQFLGLLNEVLDDLEEKKTWQGMQTEVLHTSLAQEDQGDINTIASSGFMGIVDNVLFNRTSKQLIQGPIKADSWQAAKAGIYTVSPYSYRIKGNRLYITPTLPAGHTIAFEYKSNCMVYDNSTTPATRKLYFTSDLDTSLYPDKLLVLGLRWIWKREKGLRCDEEFRAYETAATNLAGRDGGQPLSLHMDCEKKQGPAIGIPGYNWMT